MMMLIVNEIKGRREKKEGGMVSHTKNYIST